MAELVHIPRWITFDGRDFPTKEEAEAHEDANYATLLVGLTAPQITAALVRDPSAILVADAIEKAGSLIARARRAAGELRRRPNGEPDAATRTAPENEGVGVLRGSTANEARAERLLADQQDEAA